MTEQSQSVQETPVAGPTPVVAGTVAPEKQDAKKAKESESSFAISVDQVYDGPLDLLLDLIRKQDIDIYDIPIARITAQYLGYVEKIRQLDVNIAAEFIYMAAVLVQIKSRMLLPRDPDAVEGQTDDPREELVNRLLEHEKFKSAAQMLQQKQQLEDAVVSNPTLKEFVNDEGAEAELAADVIDLVRTFRQILERAKNRPLLQVDEDQVTVGQMINEVYHSRRHTPQPIEPRSHSPIDSDAPMTAPYRITHSDPTPNAIVKYRAYEASRVAGGAMSPSRACSCGLSANENSPIKAIPSHSPARFDPAARNTSMPRAPPR
jgi:segregation and condensation protein A